MSFIQSLFGSNPAAATSQNSNTTTTQPASASGNNPGVADPGKQAVADGKMPGTDQLPPNPLDAYAKLWDTANTAPEAAPVFNLDPKVLNDVSGSMDFAKSVPPEMMQKAMAGDYQSMIQIMNHVGQQSYKAALAHGSNLTDKFVDSRLKFDMKNVGTQVKSALAENEMASIPNYNHPAVKNEVKRIANQMQKQNPDASPAEIAMATKEYFTTVYSAINPSPTSSESAPKADEDWDKFFS